MVAYTLLGPTNARLLVPYGLLILTLLLTLGGCSNVDRSNLPWWVASPSAPLPKGFPAPGPVGVVKIEEYPAYRAAVNRPAKKMNENSLFFPLFNHIEKNHIAMSSPVEMTYPAEAPRSMAFIYTDLTVGKPGTDDAIEVLDFPAQLMASLGVTGGYTLDRYQETLAQLQAWLQQHQTEYTITGDPRFLAYNSPFDLPFMRYGEVQIPVARRAAQTRP